MSETTSQTLFGTIQRNRQTDAYQALSFAHQELSDLLSRWGDVEPEAIMRVTRSVAAHIAEAVSEAGALKALKDARACVAAEPVTTREA